ncbi:MAG TPA: ABC transporter permease [Thiotrichaceae bacterium]|nr:ABC transporter permease [Thiotrichaceae bacterium]HIM08711.1 ABC transporter permease [Gammaproteobacteria bacterium]
MIFIAANELRRMFKSPLAWIILATVQFLLAIFFYLLLSQYMQPVNASSGLTEIVVSGMYQISGVIMLLVSPLLTMRLITEERRLGTIKLLFSSPISITELVLGKYFGMIAFYCLILVMISLMPASLLFGTQLDLGQIASGLIGLLLLTSSFAAIGLFISSLTKQPSTAAISTFGVLFLLWIINVAGSNSSENTAAILSYLSLLKHYTNLLNGIFNSADVLFYIFVSLFFILLTIWRLDAERTHG